MIVTNDRTNIQLPESLSLTPLPIGWRVLGNDPLQLESPEQDLRMSFLIAAQDTAAAVAKSALARVKPDHPRTILRATETTDGSGWDKIQEVWFDTSATPGQYLLMLSGLSHNHAFVAIIDGLQAAFDRRGAQIAEIFDSWKPAGRVIERLVGITPTWGNNKSQALDAFVQFSMQRLGIPGGSVAVICHGAIAHVAGYGFASIASKDEITSQTCFRIGSTTKLLTTLMMARLVEQGAFEWETPVHLLMPGFSLADPEITRKLQMLHTVNASTGMPRRDMALAFRFGGISPEQRIRDLNKIMPTTGFGETFQYSNQLVALGGYVAASVANSSLDLSAAYTAAMESLVFKPLGMNDSWVSDVKVQGISCALPHAVNLDGGVSVFDDRLEHFVDSVAPAGAVWSTVADLAKYVLLEISEGKNAENSALISAEALARRRSGGIKITETESYGLGLAHNSQFGIDLFHHGGGTHGFTSDLFFIPEAGFGAVLLSNLGHANGFCEAVRRRILELAFSSLEPPRADEMMTDAGNAITAAMRSRRERIQTDEDATGWLATFAGDYSNSDLGHLSIDKQSQTMAQFEDFSTTLGMDVRSDERLIALIDAPWSGGLFLRPSKERKSLTITNGQETYVFQRK